jgi:hypothetical protein
MCQKPIVFDPRCHVHGASSPATPIAQVSNFVLRRWLACGCATDLSSDRQPAAAMVRRRSSNPNCTSRQSPFDVPSSIFMLTNIRDNTKSAESIESGDPPSERARSVANIYSQPPHPTRSLGKAGQARCAGQSVYLHPQACIWLSTFWWDPRAVVEKASQTDGVHSFGSRLESGYWPIEPD